MSGSVNHESEKAISGTCSGEIIRVSYVLRAYVKHKEFGPGPYIEIPFVIIPEQQNIL